MTEGNLVVNDMGRMLGATNAEQYTPVIRLYNETYDPIGFSQTPIFSENTFKVSIDSKLVDKASGYIIVAISMVRDGYPDTSPAQFHIRQLDDGSCRLVGVAH